LLVSIPDPGFAGIGVKNWLAIFAASLLSFFNGAFDHRMASLPGGVADLAMPTPRQGDGPFITPALSWACIQVLRSTFADWA